MRRAAPLVLGMGCTAVLAVACFQAILFAGHAFAYRDAGHFYDPLHRVVRNEWAAGRWPVWNPWQNAGSPLLGMPTAAVLYPGKLLHAVLPYEWASRWYVIGHVLLAQAGMFSLGRSLGASRTGSTVASIGYAFGAPVLSLSSNVVFLIGAAWMPWGIRAIRRMSRPRDVWPAFELAVVLAMQILGGDPEAAYLTLLAGMLAAWVMPDDKEVTAESSRRRPAIVTWAVTGGLAWVVMVLVADLVASRRGMPGGLMLARFLGPAIGLGLGIIWAWRSLRMSAGSRRWRTAIGLILAGLLAAALSAVQLVPSWEYAQRSTRVEGPGDPSRFDFSVEPYRLLELFWPHVFGLEIPENRTWIQALPPAGERMLWTPSLYMGAFVLVLAVVGATAGPDASEGPRSPAVADRRRWFLILALVGLAGALGKFAGPLWWARCIPGASSILGGHDASAGIARGDSYLSDGSGSFYHILAMVLPGFGVFRYPAKLMVPASLGLSALAAIGWDRLSQGTARAARVVLASVVAAVASGAILLFVHGAGSSLERSIERHSPPGSLFGPVDVAGALGATRWSLAQAGLVLVGGAILASIARRWPRCAGVGIVMLVTADVGIAGRRISWTVPQSALEGMPEVAGYIAEAERIEPAREPFRIHRVEQWHPAAFAQSRSPDRLAELVSWEHATLDRLHGEPYGLAYTVVRGVIDDAEYREFFEARASRGLDERGVERPIYQYPRGGYDLWNARYFIMPVDLNGWIGPERGFRRVAPGDDVVNDPDRAREWIDHKGWQLLRNPRVLPRSWVVDSVVIVPPTVAGSPERAELVGMLVDSAGGASSRPGRALVDLRRVAFVETDDPAPLEPLRSPARSSTPAGRASITRYDPQRVEIRAQMDRPGLVILSDILDPGWHLTIDGAPATTWRTNRLMRGAFVPAGSHMLVHEYRPDSIGLGAAISIGGLVCLMLLMFGAISLSLSTSRPAGEASA